MNVASDTEAWNSSLTNVGDDDEAPGPPLKKSSASSSISISKKRRLSQSLDCLHCNYRANQHANLLRHLLLHKIKSNYSCPLCSYSALRLGGITRHLHRHHPENKTAPSKSTTQAESSSTLKAKKSYSSSLCEAEKWYYDRNGRRFRYLLCDACPYKTKIRSCLEDHMKTTHPSTAAPTAPPVKREVMLHCDICQFTTRDKVAFQVHGMRHQEKSVYKCKKCSFSVPHPNVLEYHMTHHHSKRKRVVNQTQQNGAVSDKEKEEWYYAPGGGRMRYKFCQHCPYKTPVRFAFQQHVKNKHPLSNSELPAPLPRKNKAILRRCTDCPFETWKKGQLEKHRNYHDNKSAHQCHVCGLLLGKRSQLSLHLKRNHQTPQPSQADADQDGHHDQNVKVEENESNTEIAEPSIFPIPKQKKSRSRVPLKTRHTSFSRKRVSSNTSLVIRQRPKNKSKPVLLRCPHCPFTAGSVRNLRYHEALHQKKSAHECHACSYSVNNVSHLHHHLRLHHSESEKVEESLTVDQEQASSTRARLDCPEDSNTERKEKTIIRECRVVLVDMFSNCCFDAEFIEAMESTENRVGKEEEKLQEMRMQVGILTKKVRNVDEEVKEIVSNKTDLKRRITKIEGRKVKLEETIIALQVQVNESENELFALRELDESFSKDLENANKAALGASEVLCALRLELEGLESGNT